MTSFYKVAALVGAAVVLLLLPETRGKTFAELEVSQFLTCIISKHIYKYNISTQYFWTHFFQSPSQMMFIEGEKMTTPIQLHSNSSEERSVWLRGLIWDRLFNVIKEMWFVITYFIFVSHLNSLPIFSFSFVWDFFWYCLSAENHCWWRVMVRLLVLGRLRLNFSYCGFGYGFCPDYACRCGCCGLVWYLLERAPLELLSLNFQLSWRSFPVVDTRHLELLILIMRRRVIAGPDMEKAPKS